MILVTGAGGKTGKAIVAALLARGAPVRAFVRCAAHEAALTAMGAREVFTGAMDDPNALSLAVKGTEAIYHICPNVNPNEVSFATALIDSAISANVSRLVYHSVLHPQIEAMPHHWNKLRVEEILFSTALDVTVLQPAAYMQNILAEWDRLTGTGVYRVPYPIETKLSLVDLEDVAEAAATVLTSAGHTGATYELVGTSPISQVEIAETFARALNRSVHAEAEDVESWDHRARGSRHG